MTKSLPRICGIYQITCTTNKKFYIGSSVDIRVRWNRHRSELRRNIHPNKNLQNSWNKYGERAFAFSIVQECAENQLQYYEQWFLDTLQPFGKRGFNVAISAEASGRGLKWSEESRARMSVRLKGREISQEHRMALSVALKGRIVSDESRAKMSKAAKGKPKSRTQVEKRAEATKKQYIITTPDGLEFEIKGLRRFCAENGLWPNYMTDIAKGRRQHYKGWKCRYVESTD